VWLDEVYNLRGVTTKQNRFSHLFALDEVYNLRGVTTTELIVKISFSWMRYTI